VRVLVGYLEDGSNGCDLFEEDWVWDEKYPLHESREYEFLDQGFRCSENGRPDDFYTSGGGSQNITTCPDSSLMGYYFQEAEDVKMNMTVESAYRKSINTMLKCTHTEVNMSNTHVFFRIYAPSISRLFFYLRKVT
ncbi:hypothetical protein GIB67_032134, partial [Kingdonia uniflora]